MPDKPEATEDPQDLQPDEEWMQDREVFAWEFVEQNGVKSRRLYVPEAVKKRWDRKNPYKFTPEIALEIISHLTVGATKGDAAEASGVTRNTLDNWLKWSRDPERTTEELRAFTAWCHRGRSLRRIEALRRIQKAGAEDWRAEVFILERTSDEYRQHTGVALENPDGTPYTGGAASVVPHSSEEMIRSVMAMQAAFMAAGAEQAKDKPEPDADAAADAGTDDDAPGAPDAT